MDAELLQRCRNDPDKAEWDWISTYQTLSEDFIREFADRVRWNEISAYQTLSEDLIREFANRVDWYRISCYQTLSEDFIREFADRVNWSGISYYQTLSEDFIREFADRVDWIADKIKIPQDSWRYWSPEEKLEAARAAGYEIREGRIVAYKAVRSNLSSVYQPGLVYAVGREFRASNCDCCELSQNSFGLSAWTREGALEYHSTGVLLEVEIDPEDLGVIVHKGSKLRCFGFKVVGQIDEEDNVAE